MLSRRASLLPSAYPHRPPMLVHEARVAHSRVTIVFQDTASRSGAPSNSFSLFSKSSNLYVPRDRIFASKLIEQLMGNIQIASSRKARNQSRSSSNIRYGSKPSFRIIPWNWALRKGPQEEPSREYLHDAGDLFDAAANNYARFKGNRP